jgi:hypothetical protein
MKAKVLASLRVLGLLFLVAVLAYVIWQPVLPSGLIIRKMAEMIDPASLDLDRTRVVRFTLSGKGGGVYDIVAGPDKVEAVEDRKGPVDLILFMEARDFNTLMLSMARDKVDESEFIRLTLSKKMRFAGDMTLMKTLFKTPEA